MLFSCGGSGEGGEEGSEGSGEGSGGEENGKKTYTVRLIMGDGTPASSFVVQINKGTEQMGLKRVGEDGTVSFELNADNYEIALMPIGNIRYYADQSQLKISKNTDVAEIMLYSVPDREDSVMIRDSESSNAVETPAYHVDSGAYHSELRDGGYTYFIFTPQERGLYEIGAFNGDTALEIGYFGNPDNPMSFNLSDVVDGKISLEIRSYNLPSNGGYATRYLIGVKGGNFDTGILEIKKSNTELDYNPQEVEWINYRPDKAPKQHTVSYANKSVTLMDIDIAGEDITLVLGNDGYYRLGTADGPIVYVKIDRESKYLGAFSNVAENGQFCSYFYDENGKFTHKESYNEAIAEYAAASDAATGLYPLDEYLREVIIKCGDFLGWWNPDSMNYRFESVNYNENNVWMFALCTVVSETVGTDADSPYTLIDEGKISLSSGEISYATCYLNAGDEVILKALSAGTTVSVGGEELEVKDGKVTFTAAENGSVVFRITSGGECEISYSFS